MCLMLFRSMFSVLDDGEVVAVVVVDALMNKVLVTTAARTTTETQIFIAKNRGR